MRLLAKALIALLLSTPTLGGGSTPGAQIDSVSVSGSRVKFMFTASGVPADAKLDSVRVTMDGKTVNFAGATPDGNVPAGSAERAVMVVADTGSAAAAAALAPERSAFGSFRQHLRLDVATGLATTNSNAPVLVPPSTDPGPITSALVTLRPGIGNALYGSISIALGQLRQLPAGQHRLIVLANGDDTASQPGSLATVSQELAQDHVPADVIAYKTPPAATASLVKLAQASGGRFLPASDPAHLTASFATLADPFGEGLWVTAEVPPALVGRNVTLAVEERAAGTAVKAQTAISIPGTPVAATVSTSAAAAPAVPDKAQSAPTGAAGSIELYVVLALTFAAIVAVVFMVSTLAGAPRQRTLAEEIARYGGPAERSDEETQGGSLLKSVLGLSKTVVSSGGYEERTALTLDRAGMSLKPHEWLLIRCLVGVVMMGLITLLAGSIPVGFAIGALLGWISTRLYLARRVSSRLNRFSDQLPDALQLIASSLRSGFSVAQSLDRISQQEVQPLGSEMSRTLAMTRLGVGIEDALDATAERMECPDLSWVVLAIRIQREVGGNLADIIETTIDTMRERTRLRRHVRALSAEGRLSAYLLLALPVCVGGFLMVARPAYVHPLFSQPLGLFLLVVGGLLMAMGWVWMNSIVKVEA